MRFARASLVMCADARPDVPGWFMSFDPFELPPIRHRELPPLASSALVLIDLQRAFVEPGRRTSLPGAGDACATACVLLESFRSARRPVVFTRHAHRHPPARGGMGSWWKSFVRVGDPASELCRELAPQVRSGDLVLRKEHYSAFRHTRLESWLRKAGVSTLVLAGVMTHICVDTTARDAFMRGFDVVIAADACASNSVWLHLTSLLGLSDAVASVVPAQDLVDALLREATS